MEQLNYENQNYSMFKYTKYNQTIKIVGDLTSTRN